VSSYPLGCIGGMPIHLEEYFYDYGFKVSEVDKIHLSRQKMDEKIQQDHKPVIHPWMYNTDS
jgi:hypothetical protein